MKRLVPLFAVVVALGFGAWQAPAGLFSPYDPGALPTGERLDTVEVRWIQLQVPPGQGMTETLQAWRLDAPTLTFRTRCDGDNLTLEEVRGVTGTIWVAAGEPVPLIGPGCPEAD